MMSSKQFLLMFVLLMMMCATTQKETTQGGNYTVTVPVQVGENVRINKIGLNKTKDNSSMVELILYGQYQYDASDSKIPEDFKLYRYFDHSQKGKDGFWKQIQILLMMIIGSRFIMEAEYFRLMLFVYFVRLVLQWMDN